jgi:hypothetical protein
LLLKKPKSSHDPTSEARLQYTIESRPLTTQSTHRAAYDGKPRQTMIEAANAAEAIRQFVSQSSSELVSLTSPPGKESIATVQKDEDVFLVRVYSD